ncbi:MAG: ethylbenzene dehydrogenase-related protein [Sulfuritalea sp.]|nr:ethylbenzene dehydrogenase-related protein [Sulfuritalea sp.]
MKRNLATLAVVAPLTLAVSLALAAGREPASKDKPKEFKPVPVTAVMATAAPAIDGSGADAIWKTAPVTKLEAVKGCNFKGDAGKTTGTVQVAYDKENLYMMIVYDDPTQSVRRSPYQKQPDGTWAKMKDPDDKGGDNCVYYEDKIGVMWNINNSIVGFDRFGCQIACHGGEPGKPYGNKYVEEEGELGDLWHMKWVRTGNIGQIDDGYVDHTRFDAEKAKTAGRKGDAKTGGGYEDVKLVNGKPEFMSKDAKPANKGGTYWVKAEDKVPFDDSKFKPGDEVASIMIAPFAGDRGDLKLGGKWANGKWTLEISRKLVTGSKTDVNFDDLKKTYFFGIAMFDNAQVRHAYVQEPLVLQFK